MLTSEQIKSLKKEYSNHLKRRRFVRELRAEPSTPENEEKIKALTFVRLCEYKNCGMKFTTEYEDKKYCGPACRNCANVMRNYEKSKLKGKSDETRPEAVGVD
jgi:hypothetical protein